MYALKSRDPHPRNPFQAGTEHAYPLGRSVLRTRLARLATNVNGCEVFGTGPGEGGRGAVDEEMSSGEEEESSFHMAPAAVC